MKIIDIDRTAPANGPKGTYVTIVGTHDEVRSDAAETLAREQADHSIYKVTAGFPVTQDDGTERRTFIVER